MDRLSKVTATCLEKTIITDLSSKSTDIQLIVALYYGIDFDAKRMLYSKITYACKHFKAVSYILWLPSEMMVLLCDRACKINHLSANYT